MGTGVILFSSILNIECLKNYEGHWRILKWQKKIFMEFCLLWGDVHFISSAYILVAFYSLQDVIPHFMLLYLIVLL